jgi:hypothetical protein
MNPFIKIISEHLARGDFVFSMWADGTPSAGIMFRRKDGTEGTHEIDVRNYKQCEEWLKEAGDWLEQQMKS